MPIFVFLLRSGIAIHRSRGKLFWIRNKSIVRDRFLQFSLKKLALFKVPRVFLYNSIIMLIVKLLTMYNAIIRHYYIIITCQNIFVSMRD